MTRYLRAILRGALTGLASPFMSDEQYEAGINRARELLGRPPLAERERPGGTEQ